MPRSLTQKLHLGKGLASQKIITTRPFCDVYAICGACPQEGAMHFPGHVYIYISMRSGYLNSILLINVVYTVKPELSSPYS